MVIEINKDLDKYQETVAMGLTAKQLVYSVISVVVGGSMVFILYPYIGLTGAAYVAIPVVSPIALGGFYSYNGMSFYEVMSKKIYFMFFNKTLTYVSTEGEALINKCEPDKQKIEKHDGLPGSGIKKDSLSEKETDKKENTESKEDFEAVKKKMKRMLILCAVIILSLAGIAAAYKMGYLEMIRQYLSGK